MLRKMNDLSKFHWSHANARINIQFIHLKGAQGRFSVFEGSGQFKTKNTFLLKLVLDSNGKTKFILLKKTKALSL